MAVSADNVLERRAPLPVSPKLLRPGKNAIGIGLQGNGTLYYSAVLSYGSNAFGQQHGIKTSRGYERVVQNVLPDGQVEENLESFDGTAKVGELIEVTVWLEADRPYSYLVIEDPLPAGFEVKLADVSCDLCARQEVWDNKVVAFVNSLDEKKRYFTYRMRAEVPGRLNVAPTSAWAMYRPEIFASGTPAQLTVRP